MVGKALTAVFLKLIWCLGRLSWNQMALPAPSYTQTFGQEMKKNITVLATLLLLVGSGLSEGESVDPGRMLGTDYDLEQPFRPSELRRLAVEAKGTSQYNRKLWETILHAGLEKDDSLMELLQDDEIRNCCKSVDLAVSAYEYMIHGADASLDHILAHLATERIGADTDTTMILSVLNEWDKTIKAYTKHFHVADGAAATNAYLFHAVRNYLYPDEYSKHKEAFENPWK